MSWATKIDMKTSYCNRKNLLGFVTSGTLAHMAVGGLIILGAGSIGLFHGHDLAALAAFPSLDNQDQNASSVIAEDIRRASSVDSGSTNQIVLHVNAADGSSTVTYTFDPTAHTLTRTDTEGSSVLLNSVETLSFSMFQRPGSKTAYAAFAPALAGNAKMVGCRWTCSRKVAGETVSSGSTEVAPIVLRNRG